VPFEKNDNRINRDGRPKGGRNKVNAKQDIQRALKAGLSWTDMIDLLTAKILDPKVSDTQRKTYMDQLIKVKQLVQSYDLKLEKIESDPKSKQSSKERAEVKQFPQVQFKQTSN